MTETHHKV